MACELIKFSSLESEYFGFKVGRADLSDFNPRSFTDQLITERYDVVRVRLPTDNSSAELRISELGVPYYLNGIVQRFWISREAFDLKPMINPAIIFEPYSNKRRSEVKEAIRICFGEQSSGFFEAPYFRTMVPLEKQIESYSEFFIQKLENDPSQYVGWSILLDGKFAGLLINTVSDETTETVLAGVMPEFRNRQVFRDLARFSQNFGKNTGKRGGYTGARIQNSISQKLFLSEGMLPGSSFISYLITPFFGLQDGEKSRFVKLRDDDPIASLMRHLKDHFASAKVRSIKFTRFRDGLFNYFSFQMLSCGGENNFGLAGYVDSHGQLSASAWIDFE